MEQMNKCQVVLFINAYEVCWQFCAASFVSKICLSPCIILFLFAYLIMMVRSLLGRNVLGMIRFITRHRPSSVDYLIIVKPYKWQGICS